MNRIKILVAYSGGKDSQASLIWSVKKYGAKNIEAVFCDTGWENPITYKHITETTKELGVKLVTVKSKKYDGMVDMAKKKGRFASSAARFCTVELKTSPFIDYILDGQDNVLVIQGIRGDESASRSRMQAQCTFFKYYFQPYKSNTLTIEHLKSLPKLSLVQKRNLSKAKDRLAKGKNDEKYFTYRKKEVIKFVSKHSDDILRPVFDWTGQQVIDYIIDNGQKPNILYFQGFKRVGCFPCFMAGHQEVKQILKIYPERFDEIEMIEGKVKSSFFKVDYIPKRFQTGCDPRSGKQYSKAADIRKYLTNKNLTGDLFEDEGISCSSFYHLCE